MDFKANLEMLNEAQRKAVEKTEGPLLVIAGPGTGKTQLLSMRVANILKTTDTDSSQILCLTFTNKASTNMRERLRKLVGPDSRHVSVKTFHSFASDIIQKYPDYFWKGAGLVLAPDAVQLEIIEEILAKLPLDHRLATKFGGKHTKIKDVKNGLKLVKEAGLTPSKLEAIINYNLAYIGEIEPKLVEALSKPLSFKRLEGIEQEITSILPSHDIESKLKPLRSLRDVIIASLHHAIELDIPTGKTKNTGKWKSDLVKSVAGVKGMHNERQRNEWWLLLADVYRSYRKKLHLSGYYDYADMLVEVISQLEKHPDLLADTQEQFLYVLIDEFQDTNAAQMRLAHLVSSHHSSEGSPNIMAVGDDDQTIYKFNGAELNNMLEFSDTYPSTELIVLTQNYRSNQQVLNASERVINLASDRLVNRNTDISKELTSASDPEVPSGQQQLSVYPTREHQFAGVVSRLKNMPKDEWSESVVLARGHDSLVELAYLCQQEGIEVHYEQSSNILEYESIQIFNMLSQLVVALSKGNKNGADALLQNLLRHPMWGIAPQSLWNLAVSTYPDGGWLDAMNDSEDAKLVKIATWLLDLTTQITDMPLPLAIEYLMGLRELESFVSPYKDYFTDKQKSKEYLEALSGIRIIRNLIGEYSHRREATLEKYVDFVSIMQTNNQTISDDSPFTTGDSAVQLMTIHKAKGLEFKNVFILDCTEQVWKPKPARRKPPANLPLQPNGDDEDDYIRLMYVACTRAKQNIYLSSYSSSETADEVLASSLAIAAAGEDIVKESAEESASDVQVLENSLRWPRLTMTDEKAALKARLSDYTLNVTALLNFLDISRGGPEYFLERNLLKLPSAKTPSLSYGTAVHAALETAVNTRNGDLVNLDAVINSYSISLKSQFLPSEDYERLLPEGKNLLTRLVKQNLLELKGQSLAEVSFNDVISGEAKLGGSLDRLDIVNDNELIITDYKTGAGLSSLETKNKAHLIKAWKHRLQLIFYAVLVKNSPRFKKYSHVKGQMMYLEEEFNSSITKAYTPSEEDIANTEKLIEVVYKKIINLDLPDISKYPPDMTGIEMFISDLMTGKI